MPSVSAAPTETNRTDELGSWPDTNNMTRTDVIDKTASILSVEHPFSEKSRLVKFKSLRSSCQ